MLKTGEGALSGDMLDIVELELNKQGTVSVLEAAVQTIPQGDCGNIEQEAPSIFQAIQYSEFTGLRFNTTEATNDFGVAALVKANIDKSLGLCFGFLHYIGSSAVYRAFEDSPVLRNAIDDKSVEVLQSGMLGARANLRARIYNFSEEGYQKLPDKTKYTYLEFLARQAMCHLSPDQTNMNEIAIKRCMGGILAEQKVFTQLAASGYEPRFATVEEELRQVDVVVDKVGLELQIKGNSEERTAEVRVATRERTVPKVTVSTNRNFPRFRLLGTGAKVLQRAVDKRVFS